MGVKCRFINIDRRAIRADDLVIPTHIQIHMGMIKGRARAHAIEFLDTHMNFFGANIIAEMWNWIISHRSLKTVVTQ